MRSSIWEGDRAPSALWRYSSGSGHFSVDMPMPIGTALFAPGNGRVIACNDGVRNQPQGRPAGSGSPSNWLLIEFTPPTGKYKGKKVRAYLQHLDKGGTLGARPGKRFKFGDKIARSGNSGNTTGSHLHLTVFKPGRGPSGAHDRYAYLNDPGRVVWPVTDAVGDDTITVYADKLRPGVKNSKSVRTLRRALIHRGFMDTNNGQFTKKKPGNDYTQRVEEAVAKWQAKKGHKPDGVMGTPQVKQFFEPAKKVVVR